MDRNIGIDLDAWFHVRATNPGSVAKHKIRALSVPWAASALLMPRQTSFAARLETLVLRAYPVTSFTAFLIVSAVFRTACSAFPTA